MKGSFRIFQGEDLVAEFDNTITNSGRIALGRFLAEQRSSWADAMVFGSGNSTPVATNTRLDMEFWREEVDLKEYVASGFNRLTLRSIVPASVAGRIYELGIYCTSTPDDLSSRGPAIAIFDSLTEQWSGGQENNDFYRIGTRSLDVASGESASLEYQGDFRAYTAETKFRLAYIADLGVTGISVKFFSDQNNFREFTFAPASFDEYTTTTWPLSALAQTGNFDWNEISGLEVSVSGSGSVMFDGLIAFEDRPQDLLTVLVSRALVNINGQNFIEKEPNRELQVEYLVNLGA